MGRRTAEATQHTLRGSAMPSYRSFADASTVQRAWTQPTLPAISCVKHERELVGNPAGGPQGVV